MICLNKHKKYVTIFEKKSTNRPSKNEKSQKTLVMSYIAKMVVKIDTQISCQYITLLFLFLYSLPNTI